MPKTKKKKPISNNIIHRLTKAHEWLAFEGSKFNHIVQVLGSAARIIREQEEIIRSLKNVIAKQ